MNLWPVRVRYYTRTVLGGTGGLHGGTARTVLYYGDCTRTDMYLPDGGSKGGVPPCFDSMATNGGEAGQW